MVDPRGVFHHSCFYLGVCRCLLRRRGDLKCATFFSARGRGCTLKCAAKGIRINMKRVGFSIVVMVAVWCITNLGMAVNDLFQVGDFIYSYYGSSSVSSSVCIEEYVGKEKSVLVPSSVVIDSGVRDDNVASRTKLEF